MSGVLYPWGGKFVLGAVSSPVAAVTLSEEFDFPAGKLALYGNMKTENLGVEKVVANVVSNPNIRFLVVAGNDVRGHRSGDSLVCLHREGIDSNSRVVGAKSAIPYIENLPREAIERFQRQVEIVDLIGETDFGRIMSSVDDCISRNPGPFGEPMFVEHVPKDRVKTVLNSEFSLHSSLDFNPYGIVSQVES